MEEETYHIGKFAERAAVTVRTLRYYDQIGLLSPAAYTESGQRLYTDTEVVRLQQILTLKLLGFSLREIQRYLDAEPRQLFETLASQKAMLREKRAHLDSVIQAIEEVEQSVNAGTCTGSALSRLMEIIQMDQKNDWVQKYFTPAQIETMKELSRASYSKEAAAKLAAWGEGFTWTEEDQRRVDEQYARLASELERLAGEGSAPESPEAQAQAAFFLDLIAQFTRNDPEVEAGLKRWWENFDALPEEEKPMGLPWGDREQALLDKAVAIYKQRSSEGSA